MKVCVYGSSGNVGSNLLTRLKDMHGIEIVNQYYGQRDFLDADVYFLCTPPEVSDEYIKLIPKDKLIIDFSILKREESFKEESEWCYGQIDSPNLKLKNRISVAGCIASSIEVALMPIGDIKDIFITSFIGKSARRNQLANNTEPKHVYTHPHITEIRNYLDRNDINFFPVVGEHRTGIMSVCQFKTGINIFKKYKEYFKDNDRVVISNKPYSIFDAIGTDKIFISIVQEGDFCSVTSILDNMERGSTTHGIMLMNKYLNK